MRSLLSPAHEIPIRDGISRVRERGKLAEVGDLLTPSLAQNVDDLVARDADEPAPKLLDVFGEALGRKRSLEDTLHDIGALLTLQPSRNEALDQGHKLHGTKAAGSVGL